MEDYITKLLGLKEILVKSFEENSKEIKIHIETEPKYPICPVCGKKTKRIHDYRMQEFKTYHTETRNYILY